MRKQLLTLFIISFVVFACSENSEQAKQENISKEIYNPNGDSELALAMRKTFLQTEEIRKSIEIGEIAIPENYAQNLKLFHSATPTDAKVKTEVFAQFTDALYLIANDLVNSTNIESQKETYQTLISTCISCHQQFCPGPIVRIKKLNLSNK